MTLFNETVLKEVSLFVVLNRMFGNTSNDVKHTSDHNCFSARVNDVNYIGKVEVNIAC